MHAFKMQGDIVCILLNMLKHILFVHRENTKQRNIRHVK